MTIENDFLAFAAGSGANVLDQADYAASSALSTGFQAGTAPSAALNKVWRQSSIISAMIASFIVAQTGQPAIDDGTTATLLANLQAAIRATAQTNMGNAQQYLPFNTSQQLTAAQAGSEIYFFGTAAGIFTLPPASTIPGAAAAGARYSITNGAEGVTLTVNASGTDTVEGWNGTETAVLGPGDTIEFICIANNGWAVVGGTMKLTVSSLFSANLTSNGYEASPNGLIEQWGTGSITAAGQLVTFPEPFPNACLSVVICDGGNLAYAWGATNRTKTGFNAYATSGASGSGAATGSYSYVAKGF